LAWGEKFSWDEGVCYLCLRIYNQNL
jgi:hypothetical protein